MLLFVTDGFITEGMLNKKSMDLILEPIRRDHLKRWSNLDRSKNGLAPAARMYTLHSDTVLN